MRAKVRGTIDREQMIQKGDGVILGISGGADSVCLLLLLHELRPVYHLYLEAVHVEHGLRGEESLRDAAFVEELCGRLDVPVVVEHADVPAVAAEGRMGVEEAARVCRYRILERQAKLLERRRGIPAKIALAHNANDHAETILFHMVRGSGMAGLRGIPRVRGRIVRPLLDVTREEIEEYLRHKGQAYCIDSTNLADACCRNVIRHQVLPALEQINSRAVAHIVKSGDYLGEAAAHLAGEVRDILSAVAGPEGLDRRRLSEYDGFMQREALHAWLQSYVPCARDVTEAHIRQLQGMLVGETGKRTQFAGVEIAVEYDRLVLRHLEPQERAGRGDSEEYARISPGEVCGGQGKVVDAGGKRVSFMPADREKIQLFPAKNYTKWLDCANMESDLVLRTRRSGDYLVVNRRGGRKKLKDYFIDEKVPRQERDNVLLLCDGHHVLWAVGYRISEDVKVNGPSDKIIKVQVTEEESHE